MPVVRKDSPKPIVPKKVTPKVSGVSGIASRIVPVSGIKQYVKMCLYGRTGTGKTRFAATAPGPVLIIGAEDGTQSISTDPNVFLMRLEKSDDINELVPLFPNYGTIVLDTATMLQDMVLCEILGRTQLPAQKSWGMATRDQYGQCGLRVKELLRTILSAPCHVIITAQEREYKEPESNDLIIPYVGSELQPSVAAWLHPACEYVAHTFIRMKTEQQEVQLAGQKVVQEVVTDIPEYCMRVGAHPVYTTKFRVPRGIELPNVLVDPSFEQIANLVGLG